MNTQDLTILVVEDNPASLFLATEQLRLAGYQTIAAASAEEAQNLLTHTLPDLLLLDIRLPGLSGIAFAMQLRASAATATLPIIALTAQAMPDDLIAARPAGFDAYLTKPVSRQLLFTTIQSVLATHRHTPSLL